MGRRRFTTAQIISILTEAEVGIKIRELCRKHRILGAIFYNWRNKYGSMSISEAWELEVIEEENRKIKRLGADLSLDNSETRRIIVARILALQDISFLVPAYPG